MFKRDTSGTLACNIDANSLILWRARPLPSEGNASLVTGSRARGTRSKPVPCALLNLEKNPDFRGQRGVHQGSRRGRPLHPRVIAAGGDAQDAAHHGDGVTGPVLAHELEPFGGITSVSRANQAAAFERISRSNLSWRISRRRRLSSSRSAVVRPSARRPSSRSACATQLRIACADGSNYITGCFFPLWTPKTQKIGCPRKRGNFNLADGSMLVGHVGAEAVLLARRGDKFFCIGGSCSHYGGPLAEGLMVEDTVRCPWHHACFSLRTGEAIYPSRRAGRVGRRLQCRTHRRGYLPDEILQ